MSESPEQVVEQASGPTRLTRRERWRAISLFLITLVVISILLFVPVRETDIELDLMVSEVSFTLASEQSFTGALSLPTLGVSGIDFIELPAGMRDPVRTIHAADSAVRLSVAAFGNREGSITLGAITPVEGVRAGIRLLDSKAEYRLSLAGSPSILRADVQGPVKVAVAGSSPLTLDVPTPSPVLLKAGAGGADPDFQLTEGHEDVFSRQILVSKLRLYRIDEAAGTNRTLLRRVSSIMSGSLFFESLDGQERKLREGEPLDFTESTGVLRALTLEPSRIHVSFHGRVRGMETGFGEGRRSLMPTLLEWLRVRHSVALLWGSGLYIFALLTGVLRWWGIRV